MANCKHCGEGIEDQGTGHVHTTGEYQVGMNRCAVNPYGYNAEPEGEPCGFTCRGHSTRQQPSSQGPCICPDEGVRRDCPRHAYAQDYVGQDPFKDHLFQPNPSAFTISSLQAITDHRGRRHYY